MEIVWEGIAYIKIGVCMGYQSKYHNGRKF